MGNRLYYYNNTKVIYVLVLISRVKYILSKFKIMLEKCIQTIILYIPKSFFLYIYFNIIYSDIIKIKLNIKKYLLYNRHK